MSLSKRRDRVWFERTVVAGMVLVGFAVGSVGLTVLAEATGDDPVLTDEFNAPIAETDEEDPQDGVDATVTADADVAPSAEPALVEQVPPAADAFELDVQVVPDPDGNEGRQRGRNRDDGRPPRDREQRDARA